eukprot:1746138-Rhodomonas_salina.1
MIRVTQAHPGIMISHDDDDDDDDRDRAAGSGPAAVRAAAAGRAPGGVRVRLGVRDIYRDGFQSRYEWKFYCLASCGTARTSPGESRS